MVILGNILFFMVRSLALASHWTILGSFMLMETPYKHFWIIPTQKHVLLKVLIQMQLHSKRYAAIHWITVRQIYSFSEIHLRLLIFPLIITYPVVLIWLLRTWKPLSPFHSQCYKSSLDGRPSPLFMNLFMASCCTSGCLWHIQHYVWNEFQVFLSPLNSACAFFFTHTPLKTKLFLTVDQLYPKQIYDEQ